MVDYGERRLGFSVDGISREGLYLILGKKFKEMRGIFIKSFFGVVCRGVTWKRGVWGVGICLDGGLACSFEENTDWK